MKTHTATAIFAVLALAAFAAPAAAAQQQHPAALRKPLSTLRDHFAAARRFWKPAAALFDDEFGFPFLCKAEVGCGTANAPNPEVVSVDGGYTVTLDTAGFSHGELSIEVVDGARLVVAGVHECPKPGTDARPCIARELNRQYDLGDAGVELDGIRSERTEDGVLVIRLPAAVEKVRAVPIIQLEPEVTQPHAVGDDNDPAGPGGDPAHPVPDPDDDEGPADEPGDDAADPELAALEQRRADARAAMEAAKKGPARRAAKEALDKAKAELKAYKREARSRSRIL